MNWREFEQQVAQLFCLLGYQVDSDTRVQSGQTDLLALSPRRFKPNLIVECKHHDDPERKVTCDDIENFTARVIRLRNEGVIDQGYLVTNTGFTSFAKGSIFDSAAKNFVFLYTYEALLHRLLDTDFYLSDYVRQYEVSGALQRFTDLLIADPFAIRQLKYDITPDKPFSVPDEKPSETGGVRHRFLPVAPTRWTLKRGRPAKAFLKGQHDDPSVSASTLADAWEKLVGNLHTPRPKLPRALERSLTRPSRLRREPERGPTTQQVDVPCELEYLTQGVWRFLANNPARLLLLLGDFGCGKTTSMRHLMYIMAKAKLEHPFDTRLPVPLLINLKDYNKVIDFDALITTFLNNEVGVEHVNLALFRRLNEMGHFVLLLDGFDEMARLVTAAERRQTFGEICRLVTERTKIIVAGRPGYFPDIREMGEVLTFDRVLEDTFVNRIGEAKIPSYVRISCMQLMAGEQFCEYLAKALAGQPPNTVEAVARLVDHNSIADLARRPVLTNMIVESARELMAAHPDQITLSGLYQTYTSKWIRREEAKGFFRILIDAQKKSDFLGLLALHMHFLGELKIHFGQLSVLIQKHFQLDKATEVDHFSHDIRTCSFLSRDDQGWYQFAHKSFMEYFVAREFAKREQSVWKEPFGKPLAADMLKFLEPTEFPAEVRRLWTYREFINLLKELGVEAQDFAFAAALRDFADDWKKRGLSESLAKEWPVYDPRKVVAQIGEVAERVMAFPRNAEDWRSRSKEVEECLGHRAEEFRDVFGSNVLEMTVGRLLEP